MTVQVWRIAGTPLAGPVIAPPEERTERLRALGYIR
jgi:hypothetical protein